MTSAGTCCGGWTPLGGGLTSQPGALDVNLNNYSVFVRGTDPAPPGARHPHLPYPLRFVAQNAYPMGRMDSRGVRSAYAD